ncbi:MAG TPA: choice-of-anchor Q domain-containing protein [Bacteroidia bacterium]|nr:choice-of-anchor Q domain-containing protein [Bacteroidia bacterium]
MKKLLIFLSFCLISSGAFSQTLYYVNGTTGKDANNGTSLATAWKTIQKALNSATPNSIVYILAGTYHENDTVGVSGSAGKPITFRNYQNDSVYIDGTGTSGTTMLYMLQKSYLTFRGLVIQNLTVNDAIGILVDQSNTVGTRNLTFSNITIRNINWTSNAATNPSGNDNAQGFEAYGGDSALTNLIIDSCHVYSNILGQSEAISVQGNVNGFSVTNCVVYNNTNIGICAEGNYGNSSNPNTDHARNGIISQNICYNDFASYATSGGIYIDGGWNITIERNECYMNGYGVEVGCEVNGTSDSITVKNNLLYNNQEAGMAIGGYTTATTGQVLNCMIRNNTFFENNYANDGTGEIDMTKATNCVFKNNIFYTNSQNTLLDIETISPQTNNTFSYNCWYTPNNDSTNISVQWDNNSYSTFNSYRVGESQEKGSQYNNPLVISATLPTPNLSLTGGSPCYDKGDPATVISSGETDFAGNPRIIAGRIDQGAYEPGYSRNK